MNNVTSADKDSVCLIHITKNYHAATTTRTTSRTPSLRSSRRWPTSTPPSSSMFKCTYNNGKRVFVTNFPHELEKVMTKLGPFEMACTDDRVIPGADPGQRAPVRPHTSRGDAIFLNGLRTRTPPAATPTSSTAYRPLC